MGRLTVTVDDELLDEAQALLGLKTRRETITAALNAVVRQKRRERALQNRGRIQFDIDQEGLQDYRAMG
jgi:Arc/MetJ family transcription regulator